MTAPNEASAASQQRTGADEAVAPGPSLTGWRVPASPEEGSPAAPPRPADLDAAPEIFVEQVRLLYQHPSLIVVNIVNALLVVAVLWSSFPRRALVAWFALFLVLIPARLLIAYLQGHQRWPAARAAAWSVIGSAVTGAAWGLLAFAIISTSNIAYQVFIVFVLGGMTAGAVLLDAAYLPAFFAFVVPIIVPTTLAFMFRGDLMSIAMGGMLAIFAAVQAVIGRRTNQWIVDTLRLQAQRENLTADHDRDPRHRPLQGLQRQFRPRSRRRDPARDRRDPEKLGARQRHRLPLWRRRVRGGVLRRRHAGGAAAPGADLRNHQGYRVCLPQPAVAGRDAVGRGRAISGSRPHRRRADPRRRPRALCGQEGGPRPDRRRILTRAQAIQRAASFASSP